MATGKDLGRIMASMGNRQSQTDDNLSPDDPSAQLSAYFTEALGIHSQQRMYQFNYSSTAFILDHPIQGEINSAVYELDGGYSNTDDPIVLSVTNDNDRYLFHAFSMDLVDEDNTSASIDTATGLVTF